MIGNLIRTTKSQIGVQSSRCRRRKKYVEGIRNQMEYRHHTKLAGMPALKKFLEMKQGANVGKIILHPEHPDYCKECVHYIGGSKGCASREYDANSYYVNCVWHYCPYKRKKTKDDKRRTHN